MNTFVIFFSLTKTYSFIKELARVTRKIRRSEYETQQIREVIILNIILAQIYRQNLQNHCED